MNKKNVPTLNTVLQDARFPEQRRFDLPRDGAKIRIADDYLLNIGYLDMQY